QSAPPGFTVRLFGEGLEAWQSAVRAAYQQRFGRELVAPHAPEKPDTSAVEAVRIARVKLVSPPESAAADPPSAVPNPKSECEPATQPEAISQPHPEPAEPELAGDAHAPTTLVSVEQPPNDSASELPTEPAERGAERGSNPPPQASMDPPASTDEALSDALATRAEPMQERYEPAQPADTDEESSRPARVVASTKPPKRGSAGAMLAWLMVF